MAKYTRGSSEEYGDYICRECNEQTTTIYLSELDSKMHKYISGAEVSSYGKRKLFQKYLFNNSSDNMLIVVPAFAMVFVYVVLFCIVLSNDYGSIEMENPIDGPYNSKLFTYEGEIYQTYNYEDNLTYEAQGVNDDYKQYYYTKTKGE